MKKIKIKIGILSLQFFALSTLVITSAFGAIIAAFPGTSITQIQLIATIPNITIILVSLIAGPLMVKFPKKVLALVALGFISIGGLTPIIFHNTIMQLLVCASILGIGLGLAGPLVLTLSSMYFSGEERAGVMGMIAATTQIGRMVLVTLGGFLGATYWHRSYYVFFITIIAFIFVLLFLPMDSAQKTSKVDIVNKGENKPRGSVLTVLSGYLICVILVSFASRLLFTTYNTNLAIVISDKEFGGTTVAGLVGGLGTLGGIMTGLTIKYSRKIFKDKVLAVGFLIFGLAALMAVYAPNPAVMVLAGILTTVGTSYMFSTMPFLVSLLVNPQEIPIAMSLFNFFASFGSLLAPIIMNGMGIGVGIPSFTFAGILALSVGAFLIIVNLGARIQGKKEKKDLTNTNMKAT